MSDKTLFRYITNEILCQRIHLFVTAVGKKVATAKNIIPYVLAEKVITIMQHETWTDIEILHQVAALLSIEKIHASIAEKRRKSRVADIEAELRMVRSHHSNPIRYLDIGCSEGQITSAITEELGLTPDNAHACDISLPHHVNPQQSTFTFTQSGSNLLPYTDNSFDLITMFMSAHHFSDLDSMLVETVRVSRPGAFLLMREHDIPVSMEETASAYYDIAHALYACTQIARPPPAECTPEEFMRDYHCPGGFAQYKSIDKWIELLAPYGFQPVTTPHGPLAFSKQPQRKVIRYERDVLFDAAYIMFRLCKK